MVSAPIYLPTGNSTSQAPLTSRRKYTPLAIHCSAATRFHCITLRRREHGAGDTPVVGDCRPAPTNPAQVLSALSNVLIPASREPPQSPPPRQLPTHRYLPAAPGIRHEFNRHLVQSRHEQSIFSRCGRRDGHGHGLWRTRSGYQEMDGRVDALIVMAYATRYY